jgi:hypothetical protein
MCRSSRLLFFLPFFLSRFCFFYAPLNAPLNAASVDSATLITRSKEKRHKKTRKMEVQRSETEQPQKYPTTLKNQLILSRPGRGDPGKPTSCDPDITVGEWRGAAMCLAAFSQGPDIIGTILTSRLTPKSCSINTASINLTVQPAMLLLLFSLFLAVFPPNGNVCRLTESPSWAFWSLTHTYAALPWHHFPGRGCDVGPRVEHKLLGSTATVRNLPQTRVGFWLSSTPHPPKRRAKRLQPWGTHTCDPPSSLLGAGAGVRVGVSW